MQSIKDPHYITTKLTADLQAWHHDISGLASFREHGVDDRFQLDKKLGMIMADFGVLKISRHFDDRQIVLFAAVLENQAKIDLEIDPVFRTFRI